MAKISIEKLLELGVISKEQYEKAKALEESSTGNRLVQKYGQPIVVNSETLFDFFSKLKNGVVVVDSNKIYLLPYKIGEKDLKFYYRSKTDTEF